MPGHLAGPARTAFEGRPVSHAVMCEYALTEIASSRADRACPAFDPTASGARLTADREDWRGIIVRDRAYELRTAPE